MKEKISEKILEIEFLMECVRDACVNNDYYACESVLNIAISKQQEIYDELEYTKDNM